MLHCCSIKRRSSSRSGLAGNLQPLQLPLCLIPLHSLLLLHCLLLRCLPPLLLLPIGLGLQLLVGIRGSSIGGNIGQATRVAGVVALALGNSP